MLNCIIIGKAMEVYNQNMAKLFSGWSPLWLHHKILQRKSLWVKKQSKDFLCFCFLLSYLVCSQNMAKLFSRWSPLWLGTLNPKPRTPLRKSLSTSESATKIMGAASGGGVRRRTTQHKIRRRIAKLPIPWPRK